MENACDADAACQTHSMTNAPKCKIEVNAQRTRQQQRQQQRQRHMASRIRSMWLQLDELCVTHALFLRCLIKTFALTWTKSIAHKFNCKGSVKGKGKGLRGHCGRVRKIPNVEAKVSMGFNYEPNKKLQLHRLSCCQASWKHWKWMRERGWRDGEGCGREGAGASQRKTVEEIKLGRGQLYAKRWWKKNEAQLWGDDWLTDRYAVHLERGISVTSALTCSQFPQGILDWKQDQPAAVIGFKWSLNASGMQQLGNLKRQTTGWLLCHLVADTATLPLSRPPSAPLFEAKESRNFCTQIAGCAKDFGVDFGVVWSPAK